ncbi:MAG: pseudouridine synthase [Mesorhizobium sp.]|nr:pseudouridine synthase [Mesorhizobium sp.]
MSDERKRFPGKRGPGAPGGKPGDAPRSGPAKAGAGGKPAWKKDAKPAWKKDGKPASSEKRATTPRAGGAAPEKREYRPRRDDAPSGDAPKRSHEPRAEGAPERERTGKPFRKPETGRAFAKSAPGEKPFGARDASAKPYRKPSGDKPFRPRPDGDKPFRKFDGDAKPFRQRDDDARPARAAAASTGEKRAYTPRRDDAPSGEKRAYTPRREGGDERPFRKPDGDRPFRATGDKPYRKPEGDRPFRKPDGDKPFRPRPDGDKPFRARSDGDKPFRGRPDSDGPKRFGAGSDRPRPSSARLSVRDEAAPEEGERIAKRLARAGISSRRDAEEMIAAGRVKVNGKVLASPAFNVGPDDAIHVDNELIPAIERTRLFLFNKPSGVVTTNRDPEGRRTVFDVLPAGLPRLITIGRLDINTEGLMLLTNDGGLARVLELPSTGWMRRYRARVHGRVDENALKGLRDGVAVDGVFYGSIEASLEREQGSNAWLMLGLREGKNREVKNVLGSLGLEVSRLIRISYGPFQLGELADGAVQELNGKTLRDQLGERLIEESGANFEAPITTEFSNKPVVREREWAAPAPRPREPRTEAGEGGLIKNRKRDQERHREDMLGRLTTKRPPGPRGPKRGDKKEEKPYEPPRSRSSNVWMASGARPVGKKAEAAEGADERKPRTRAPGGDDRRPSGKPGGTEGLRKPRPASPSGDGAKPAYRPRGPRKGS